MTGGHGSAAADPAADVSAIHDLLSRYAHTIDALDVEGWLSCFAPGATFEVRDVDSGELLVQRRGLDDLRRHVTGRAAPPWPAPQHFVAAPSARVEGDSATARSYLQIVSQEGSSFVVTAVGLYHDVLRRVDGEWRIAQRTLDVRRAGHQSAGQALATLREP